MLKGGQRQRQQHVPSADTEHTKLTQYNGTQQNRISTVAFDGRRTSGRAQSSAAGDAEGERERGSSAREAAEWAKSKRSQHSPHI